MFTGIIERTATVTKISDRGRVRIVTIKKPATWSFKKGQSISVSGVCSTVISSTANSFVVEYMPETLRVTAAGSITKGSTVNLERSLKYGDRMDGHMVQGHIEGTGRIGEIRKEGRSHVVTLKLPAGLARYAVDRGSIALDGVSLTVAKRHGPWVSVALVPHTLKETTLKAWAIGDLVNVETDIMARHRLLIKPRARVITHARKPLRKRG